ncbi:MAG: hypothetical protein Q8K02_15270, partial [Flavobacterium sp.]|nr:hypothetical protein [Flavobacterium sp.]
MKFIYFIVLIICFGCSTKNINYDRNKIIEKYNTNYKFYLNDEEIVFENFFLNKNNIDRIIVDKRGKTILIHQKFKSQLFRLKEYNLDRFINDSFKLDDLNCQDCVLAIDGFLFPIEKLNEIYFSEKSI